MAQDVIWDNMTQSYVITPDMVTGNSSGGLMSSPAPSAGGGGGSSAAGADTSGSAQAAGSNLGRDIQNQIINPVNNALDQTGRWIDKQWGSLFGGSSGPSADDNLINTMLSSSPNMTYAERNARFNELYKSSPQRALEFAQANPDYFRGDTLNPNITPAITTAPVSSSVPQTWGGTSGTSTAAFGGSHTPSMGLLNTEISSGVSNTPVASVNTTLSSDSGVSPEGVIGQQDDANVYPPLTDFTLPQVKQPDLNLVQSTFVPEPTVTEPTPAPTPTDNTSSNWNINFLGMDFSKPFEWNSRSYDSSYPTFAKLAVDKNKEATTDSYNSTMMPWQRTGLLGKGVGYQTDYLKDYGFKLDDVLNNDRTGLVNKPVQQKVMMPDLLSEEEKKQKAMEETGSYLQDYLNSNKLNLGWNSYA